MNLIFERWIPIRRKDGSHSRIAPWELTDGLTDNPILAVASPRPDFDGALTEFLIGLLQTACSPSEDQWWDWRERAPTPDVLEERFKPLSPAFQLIGAEGPLFMQERLGDDAKEHDVTYLLIGSPTDNTLKNNIDHFQKRPRGGECLCRACAAAALYTLQTYAPGGGGGGDGKFTGLRGGGPLTTLILGNSLWETVWLNVSHGETFSVKNRDEKTFPWLKTSAFISEAAPVKVVSSTDMQPEHVFWGMPRRIKLSFAADNELEANNRPACLVCGCKDEVLCTGFIDQSGGLTYQQKYSEPDKKGKDTEKKRPAWIDPRHPLSPYTINENEEPSTIHPQPGGVGYRDWLGLVENITDGNTKRRTANVVEQFRSTNEETRLWAFGVDFVPGQPKARCWYDATMPLLAVACEHRVLFSDNVERMVKAAQKVEDDLRKSLKSALFPEKSKIKTDQLNFVGVFWNDSESSFYEHLRRLHATLPTSPLAHPVLESWLKILRVVAYSVFDRHSGNGDFDSVNPRRIALARNNLGKALNGSALSEKILGLPKLPRPKPNRRTP